jgi:heterotetrameric sarcosine oxidase gamma subunit
MIEASNIKAATESPVGRLNVEALSVHEHALRPIWSIQSNQSYSLEDFVRATFNTELNPERLLQQGPNRLIQLSPYRALMVSESPAISQAMAQYESMLTDVSHGYCELCVTGKQSFDFLRLYVSANMSKVIGAGSFSVNCLLGQYRCLLWWDDSSQIHILVERSYAQSFRHYLSHLMQRHHWS